MTITKTLNTIKNPMTTYWKSVCVCVCIYTSVYPCYTHTLYTIQLGLPEHGIKGQETSSKALFGIWIKSKVIGHCHPFTPHGVISLNL